MKFHVSLETSDQQRDNAQENIQTMTQQGETWFLLNRGVMLFVMPIAIWSTAIVAKVIRRCIQRRKNGSVKTVYCFDNRVGHDWVLRRELSNNEWLVIDARTKNGEDLSAILSEMRVLR